jgi:hypothetical protein
VYAARDNTDAAAAKEEDEYERGLLDRIGELEKELFALRPLKSAPTKAEEKMTSHDDSERQTLQHLRERVVELEAEVAKRGKPEFAAAIFLDSEVGRTTIISVGRMRVALQTIGATETLEGAHALADAALKNA